MTEKDQFIDDYLAKRQRVSKNIPVIRGVFGGEIEWMWVKSSPKNVKQSRLDLHQQDFEGVLGAIATDPHAIDN